MNEQLSLYNVHIIFLMHDLNHNSIPLIQDRHSTWKKKLIATWARILITQERGFHNSFAKVTRDLKSIVQTYCHMGMDMTWNKQKL